MNINSNIVRFYSKDNILYINKDISYNEFMNIFVWNTPQETEFKLNIYNENKELVTDGTVTEGYSLEVLYHNEIINTYLIKLRQEYIEYQEEAKVEYTSDYGIDILKHLNIENTFIDIRTLIDTDGEITIQDKDDNELEENSKIKTGDKFVVTFSTSSYYIYLSVKGDITGKGLISNEDVLKSYQILRGEEVETYYELASDINEDGILKINDVARLHQYVEKKIDELS